MASISNFEYISGGTELLDDIAHLWTNLNQLHANVSPYFFGVFENRVFNDRKKELLAKAQSEKLRIDIVKTKDNSNVIGYCVSTAKIKGQGEIDSIFVEEQYRHQGVARQLMNSALEWMNSLEVTRKTILVAFGNDKALAFYKKFGFRPSNFELVHKAENT